MTKNLEDFDFVSSGSNSTDECETCGAKDGGDGGSVEWRSMEDKKECDRCYHGRGSNF